MYIQIEDPSDLPRPPEEVQIRAIDIDPYPDGRRLHVQVELTPFIEPPDLEIRVLDASEAELAELSIIGAHQKSIAVTVHLSSNASPRACKVVASIHYEDIGQVHQFIQAVELGKERDDGRA